MNDAKKSAIAKLAKMGLTEEEVLALFEDEEETFNKKPTGNRVLGLECRFCAYKKPCWGKELQYLPQQQSKALNPKWVWYTKLDNPRLEEEQDA